MQKEELIQLLRDVQRLKIEKNKVELKSTCENFPEQLYDTISAFANQDPGGVILFGVREEEPLPEIVGVYDPDDVEKKIRETCQQMEPAVQPVITTCTIEGKKVVSSEIPGADWMHRPVCYAGIGNTKGSFVRTENGMNRQMTPYEIYRYQAFREQLHEDLRTVDRVNMRFFDQKRLKDYLKAVKNENPKLAEELSDENILEVMGVLYDKKPTLAGVISFSIYPQTYFPQLNLTAAVMDEMKENPVEQFTKRKKITGAIPEILDGAIEFVRQNRQLRESQPGETLPAGYPERAVREAVLNALLHRDYSVYTESIPASLELYRDRLVVRNSGGLYGCTTLEELGVSRPEIRNPVLANILQQLRISRNCYSGIPLMRSEMQRAGLPAPEFRQERGEFEVILYNRPVSSPESFRLPDRTPPAPVARPEPVEERRVLPPVQPESEHEEKTRQRIAEFCRTPRTRQELIEFTGVSRYYLISRYIQPMIEEQILAYTVPERPKSKFQKFVTIRK